MNWKYILVVVILTVIVGGGILAWQYWWVPKEEISVPTLKLKPIRLFYSVKSNELATIYEIDINGENQTKLIDFGPTYYSWAKLSPDGNEIIFGDKDNGIYIYDLNTKQRRVILRHQRDIKANGKETNEGYDVSKLRTYREPLWSPNGSLIALDTGMYESMVVTVIDTQGKKIAEYFGYIGGDRLDWASDSQRIAVVSQLGMGSAGVGLFLFDIEDTEAKQIIPAEKITFVFTPQWSPDDRKIAFALDVKGTVLVYSKFVEIFTINPDGSELSQLTYTDSLAQYPVWTNDGKKIAYGVRKTDVKKTDPGIYLITIAGDKNVLLYRHDNYQWYQPLEWSPDGEYLLFLMGKKPIRKDLVQEGNLALAVVSKDGRESKIIAQGEDVTFVGWSKK